MNIEVKSENIINNDDAISSIKNIISSAVEQFIGDQIKIDKIVVTDAENLGKEIQDLQKKCGEVSGYTKNEVNVACAKVITKDGKNSSIVFVDYIFAAILNAFSGSENVDEWDIESQLFYYVIFHELSHCYDDQARKSIYTPQSFKRSSFSQTQIKEHYICTIFSEFSACALSGRKMTHAAYLKELNDTIIQIDDQMVALEEEKHKYRNKQIEIVDMAYHVAQTSWFIITQFSKIIGSSINLEREYSIHQIPELPKSQISITPVISELDTVLKALWTQYPNWTLLSVKPINSIHEKILGTLGYSFNGNDEHGLSILN